MGGTAVGTNSPNYTPTPFASAGTFYYYAEVSLSGSGCGKIKSNLSEVIVIADPIITSQPIASQNLCEGSTASNLTLTVTGGIGSYSYQWYSNTSNSTLGGVAVGMNSAIFTPPTTTVGTKYYYCIVSQTSSGCAVTSAISLVNVLAAPTINNQPQSESICIGGSPSSLNVSFINGAGTATYQWYDDNGLITGATNASINPTVNITNTYYCIITFSSGGCTSITSNKATITVNPLPTINLQPLVTQSICVGGVISALTISYSDGNGTPTYQWYSNSINSNSGGTAVGTNSPNYTPPAFAGVGPFYYYATISLSGNGCGKVTSNVSEVIVVSDPIITTQPLNTQTLCEGSTASILSVIASGGLGTFTYQWYTNSPPETIIPGATSDNYTPDSSIVGLTNYYCIISQPNLGCEVKSNLAEVNIVAAPKITTQPTSSSVCEGNIPATLTVAYTNGTGTATYQWFSNTDDSNSDGIAISGATTDTYIPQFVTLGTIYYYCEITFSSGGCSLITSNTAEVIINQIPVITNQKIVACSGDPINFVPQDGNGNIVPSNTLFTWTIKNINPVGSITGATLQSIPQNGLNQTLKNTTTDAATIIYIVTPTASICTGNTFEVEVAVYPKPEVVFDISNQTICNNSTSTQVNLSSASPGTISFAWIANIPAGISGATVTAGTNTIPPQTFINSTNQPLIVTYSANATFNFDGVGCDGANSIYQVTVNPEIIASGTTSNYNGYGVSYFGATDGTIDVTVEGGSGNYTYSWSGTNGFAALTQDINGVPAGKYSVTINDSYCPPVILNFVLTQPPELLFEEDLAVHVNLLCFGYANGAFGITITQESIPPYDFQVVNSSGTVVTFVTDSSDINQLFSGLSADTYTVIITDANGGIKKLNGITLTQPDEILISVATTPITCYGANDASITLTVSGGTAPYQAQQEII